MPYQEWRKWPTDEDGYNVELPEGIWDCRDGFMEVLTDGNFRPKMVEAYDKFGCFYILGTDVEIDRDNIRFYRPLDIPEDHK